MGRLNPLLLTLILTGATAMALASCGGGSDADLLPGTTANEIESNLDQVQQLVAGGDCIGAEDAVAEVAAEVEALDGVAPKLKAALEEGTSRLSEVVSRCNEEVEEETEPSAEEDVEAGELEQADPKAEEEAEKAREKAEKEREKAEAEEEKEEEKAEAPEGGEESLPPQSEGNGNAKGQDEGAPTAPAPPVEEEGSSGGVAPSVGVE